MDLTLILQVLTCLLFPTLITADCTVRDPLVGIGYNLIYGNPDGDDELAGRDPGLKYNYKILDLTYNEGKSTTIRGTEYCEPDQVKMTPLTSCSYDEETYIFSGTASYQEVFSSMVSVDSSYDNGLSSYEFSLSSEYESVNEASETSESVFFDKRAFCHESQSRFRIENIPNDDSYGVTTDFYNAFDNLPDVANGEISSDELEEYYDLLTDWGTHILEESDLGGRRVQRYQSTLTELYEYALETSDTSISLGGEYNGFSTSVSMDISTLSESTSSSSEFGSYYKEISTGSKLEYDEDGTYWYIPDDDTSSPEPTQLYLVSIATVCDSEGYWSTISDLSDVTAFLANRCENLIAAIQGYAEYLQLSAATDASTLPITWPSGKYGLIKSTDGCPQETSGFSFATGWREQRPHAKGKHSYSSGHHFEGTMKSNKVKYYFCMKKAEASDSSYVQSWPAGQYCIYMADNEDCPSDSFTAGYVKYRDRARKGKRSKKSKSNLPEGVYKKDKTIIYYCCREDGNINEEIYLPNTEPFYLMQKGDDCQKVGGMTFTNEYMEIDSKKKGSGYDGSIPYITGKNSYTMYYCYYQPEE